MEQNPEIPAWPGGPVPQETSCAPAQVETAFEVVRWANMLEIGSAGYRGIDAIPSRPLSPRERSVYEAALEVLRLYLTGEMSFQCEPVQPQKTPEIAVSSENVKTTS